MKIKQMQKPQFLHQNAKAQGMGIGEYAMFAQGSVSLSPDHLWGQVKCPICGRACKKLEFSVPYL